MIELLIGLLIGFYAMNVYSYIKKTYEMLADKFDSHQAGVVQPTVSKVTRNQPINLESNSGPILKMSPNQVLLDRMKEREEKIKYDVR